MSILFFVLLKMSLRENEEEIAPSIEPKSTVGSSTGPIRVQKFLRSPIEATITLSNLPPDEEGERPFTVKEGIQLVGEHGIDVKDAFMINETNRKMVIQVDPSTNPEAIDMIQKHKNLEWRGHRINLVCSGRMFNRRYRDPKSSQRHSEPRMPLDVFQKYRRVEVIFEDCPPVRNFALKVQDYVREQIWLIAGTSVVVCGMPTTRQMSDYVIVDSIETASRRNVQVAVLIGRENEARESVTVALMPMNRSANPVEDLRNIPLDNAVRSIIAHFEQLSQQEIIRDSMLKIANGDGNVSVQEYDCVIEHLTEQRQRIVDEQSQLINCYYASAYQVPLNAMDQNEACSIEQNQYPLHLRSGYSNLEHTTVMPPRIPFGAPFYQQRFPLPAPYPYQHRPFHRSFLARPYK
ncbi:hypothetical protein ACOME3_001128 [Neoechinorhynchus agilis]